MRDLAKSAHLDSPRVLSYGTPPVGGTLKRAFDVVAASIGIVALLPLFLFLIALVKITDPGPAFYGHARIGRGGRSFACLKFRTMMVNGDEVLAAHLRDNPAARDEWLATRKLRNDPRVTRVGHVLRKLSLDELPQLLNILQGDMSIVGPRPVVHAELEHYGPFADCYLKSRPGLTGLWQVSGRSDVSYEARVAFDRQYIENWSLAGDLRIILLTVPAVCLSRGSY
jgi:exopolysaccharide production protein ExoY